jgi:WD40 repeat protein
MESLDSQTNLLMHEPHGISMARFDAMTAVLVDSAGIEQTWDRATRARTGPPSEHVTDAVPVGERILLARELGAVSAVDRDGTVRWTASGDGGELAAVRGIAGSAAGNVAIGFGPTTRLWNLDDGATRATLASPAPIATAVFDRAGSRVATGDITGGVRVWDARSGAALATCTGHGARVRSAQFSSDGALLVSGGEDGTVLVCDPATGALAHRLDGHPTPVIALDISKDARRIASGGSDGSVRIWDTASGRGEAKLDAHDGVVVTVRFSPEGTLLATAAIDSMVHVWDAEAGTLVATLQGGAATAYVEWEASGRAVLTAGIDGTLRRWDVDAARRGRIAKPHADGINDFRASPDGRWIATTGADGLAISDARTLEPHAAIRELGAVDAARFAADSKSLVVTQHTGAVSVWSVDGARLRTLPGTGYGVAEILGDGTIVTGGADKQLRFWSGAGAEVAHVALDFIPAELDVAGTTLLAIPDFADRSTRAVPVIDLASHAIVAQLRGEHAPHAATMSATQIATADGSAIRLWERGTWRAIGTLEGHRGEVSALGFLPDGRLVSGADDHRALVWGDGRLLAALASNGNRVYGIATAADGATFATSSLDGAVRVWDAATYQPLLVQPSHRGAAYAVAYAADGVISGGADGRVARWELPHPRRSLAELDRVVRCRVPFQLEHDTLLPRELDYDDATCR